MKKYTQQDIINALVKVGIQKGDIVNIHSSLLTLGRITGETKQNPVQSTVNTILHHIGENGTLVAPTFNFDFCKGIPYNRQETPSKNMGVISEFIRCLEHAKRSPHPMQSVAAIGHESNNICEFDTSSAFDNEGAFGRMLKLNATLLLYGVSFQAASFIHYLEEKHQVPYRYWKKFTGPYIDNGKKENREYKMYVRNLDLNPILDVTVLQKKMEEKGTLYSAKLGMGKIYSCSYKDFYTTADDLLLKDPLSLLKNKKEVIKALEIR